jgi:hypothetical protein
MVYLNWNANVQWSISEEAPVIPVMLKLIKVLWDIIIPGGNGIYQHIEVCGAVVRLSGRGHV